MWHRLTDSFNTFGFRDGALYLVHRLLQRVSSSCGLFVYDVTAQSVTAKPLLPERWARNLRCAEIPLGHPDIAAMPAREDIKVQRFAQGAICLGVYRGDQLLGYIWYCFGGYDEDEVRFRYELTDRRRTVFDFDLYILPEHRMGIGFAAVLHFANQYLRSKGVDYSFSRLTRFNLASRRSHSHVGLATVASTYCLQLGPLEMAVSSISPHFAMTSSKSRRISFKLSPQMVVQAKAHS